MINKAGYIKTVEFSILTLTGMGQKYIIPLGGIVFFLIYRNYYKKGGNIIEFLLFAEFC